MSIYLVYAANILLLSRLVLPVLYILNYVHICETLQFSRPNICPTISPLDDTPHDVLVPQLGLAGLLVLVGLLPGLPQPGDQAHEAVHGGDDVEGRGQGGPGLEIADPQLGPGKFPFTEK